MALVYRPTPIVQHAVCVYGYACVHVLYAYVSVGSVGQCTGADGPAAIYNFRYYL